MLALAPFLATAGTAQSVAVVKSRDLASFDKVLHSLERACATCEITAYSLKGKKENGDEITRQIHQATPDIVLALGPLAAQIAKDALPETPVLYGMVSNPNRYELAGTNIAGISLDVPCEQQFKQYRILVPGLQTIGVIYDPEKSADIIAEADRAARRLGLTLVAVPVSSPKKVPGALRGILNKIDALWTVPDDTVLTTDSFRFFLVTTFEHKLPFFAISDIFVKVGALATIGPEPGILGRELHQLIDGVYNGQLDIGAVDEIPPDETGLVINLKTAGKIGLKISPAILETASKLYQ